MNGNRAGPIAILPNKYEHRHRVLMGDEFGLTGNPLLQ